MDGGAAAAAADAAEARRLRSPPPAADPGAIAADAYHLRMNHAPSPGNGYWWRRNSQPDEPQLWWHIRYTTGGAARVQNYWKHRGGPDLSDNERAYLVDDAWKTLNETANVVDSSWP